MRKKISLSQREREDILRSVWTLHDARWFMKTAEKFGFDVANELNHTVIRSIGKTEIRTLLMKMGTEEIRDMEELKNLMETAAELFSPKGHRVEYEILDDNRLVRHIHITDCNVHRNVEKAGYIDRYRCAAETRFSSWIEAFGLDGDVNQDKTERDCNGNCETVFTMKID